MSVRASSFFDLTVEIDDELGKENKGSRRAAYIGLSAIAISFACFMSWSLATAIASATVAQGTVVVVSGRKYIENLLGGTVEVIGVEEGQKVRRGQLLAKMNTDQYDIIITSMQALLASNVGQQARLTCEQLGCRTPIYPSKIEMVDDVRWHQAVIEQQAIFHAQTTSLSNRLDASQTNLAKARLEAPMISDELSSAKRRLALTSEELRTAMLLAQQGNGTRQRVIEVARAFAELQGEVINLQTKEVESQHEVKSEQIDIARLTSSFSEEAVVELQQVDREHEELVEKLATVLQQRKDCYVRAPVNGRVVNLSVHTIGGVVAPGAPLLELVPEEDKLVIDAKVSPTDVTSIKPGLPVDIRFPGLDGQRMPRLTGKITNVSADRLEDAMGGKPYFLVRAELPSINLLQSSSHELKVGTEVTVMISKGEQTPIRYLIEPLLTFFASPWG